MVRRIGAKRRASMIQDIFNAEHDVVALAQAHGLAPDELARWVAEPANQQCLSGLCVVADLQTQLLLSRYRLLAAGRLIRLATQEDEGTGADVARRACVDLLKLDLKRAEASGDVPAGELEEQAQTFEALRATLYEGSEAAQEQD